VYTVNVPKGDPVFKNRNGHVLVFDVGGSHLAGGVFKPEGLGLGATYSVPIVENGTVRDFLDALAGVAELALPDFISPTGISVAMPNPFDYARGISYMEHKYRQLYGVDLRSALAKLFCCDPGSICFLNDAAAFLIGEHQAGETKGIQRIVGITLGTGVGSAFAVSKTIVTTGKGVPPGGEIWNLPYKNGIVENFVSALAIQRLHEQSTGTWAEVQDIARLGTENTGARETFEEFGKELGKVLRETCLAFAPERIVLGGGISRAASLFLPSLEEELADFAIEICVSQLGEHAPLLGAGVNWVDRLNSSRLQEQARTGEAD
jgi:glucokinase